MAKAIDLTGRVFGRLTVVAFSHRNKRRIAHWKCTCVCGGVSTVAGGNLTSGNSTTCGCRNGLVLNENLTQLDLFKILKYDPDTGIFTWRVTMRNKLAGSRAGCYHPDNGYERIGIGGQTYYSHVLAWLYMTSEWPSDEIDHKDLDGANNRWNNLRIAGHMGNSCNKEKPKRNRSGYKGVWQVKDRFLAKITYNKRVVQLGSFTDPIDAAIAYDVAARKYHGVFARFNFGE